ncbi:conserved hypothetical protein [Leishmania mexicana MHOM/GT/2001/U1103]|uniref:Adenylate cyclase n=1 Tax=Leishmania mexicana (strain MHOM/GT/2001/U1103) TaxID=929439 RepID=E9B4U6_LEIMU|nr:conserved hypothetical protein [Leishmania mexicana MHOM/GT/2001/U1103]CBZ30265.1 conserved hypothetical protein [Leishmania mexicana MHOM/GT/2001/U1103]
MEGFAVMSDAGADARMKEKDAHLTNLIIEKREAAKQIEGLKAEIADLRARLSQATSRRLLPYDEGLSSTFAAEKTALKNTSIEEISIWNEELIHTIEQLQRSLIQLEADSKAQLITLTDRLDQLRKENERLLRENDSLKARIGDDVLRQRQANRIEVAFERGRIAARVRAAGLHRLEAAEANLMEAHDDVYHVQRWDAILLPQRDVSFVFHFVSNVTYPLGDIEELVMRVYQQLLFHSSSCCRGYRVGFYKSMEVFAFQAPSDALLFAKECHEQLVRLSWFSCIESMPAFSTITENNKVLYKGPRIHTCIFTCSPESYVDPVSGKYAFFGPEVAEAVQAAIEQCPIGEIVVNEKWAQLMCMQSRMREDRSVPTESNAAELRECLGSMWNVVGLPGAHHIIASILPSGLRSRRGVEASVLYPSRKYPCLEMKDSASEVRMVVKGMKGMLPDAFEGPEEGRQKSNGGGDVILQQMRRRANFWHDAVVKAPLHTSTQEPNTEFSDSAAKLLELFVVQKENSNLIALYRKTEAASAALERNMMESEDRFEIRKHKTLHSSETAYICTIDTGDESIWKQLLLKSISDEQFESIQNTIRGDIHNAAKVHFGFLMSGNYSDVFTYVFREVEQALAFVSEMYIKVNRTGTKYAHTSLGKGRDVFLFRAGVASGPMTSIYRNLENGVLKCTGPAIRLSGTLCDLAESGEILAMEDVVRSFYSKKENLLDTQYIVKQRPQFIGSHDPPAMVHSILPKPFAYRHKQLRNFGRAAMQNKNLYLPYRSVLAALTLRRDELPRQGVLDMMEQQQRRLELGEMARMSAEDNYERGWEVSMATTSPLRSPWLLLCQPQAEEKSENVPARRRSVRFRTVEEVEADLMYVRRSTKPLAFLYCDVAGAGAIARSVAPPLLRLVWAHYNYIVQNAVRSFSGYVAKTNSTTSYLVVFEEPTMALEAARQIQLEMVESIWPEELRMLESTLHVKDIKSHTVLFNGPRPQISVHVSDQYMWCFMCSSSSPPALKSDASSKAVSEGGADGGSATAEPLSVVHISGVGVDETFVLGLHARGGEIRLSRSLLNAVGAHPSGKLLLAQLRMELVVTPRIIHSVEGAKRKSSTTTEEAKKAQGDSEPKAVKANVFVEECVASVPRRLEGRLALIPPSTSTAFGAAKRTEAALAMATASVAEGNAESTSGEDDGAVPADDTGRLESATPAAATTETAGLALATLPKTMVLPTAMMAQHAWLVEPEESFNPLPAASLTDWSTVTPHPADRLKDLGLLEVTCRIQAELQELLKMFPSAQLLAQAVEGVADESASELPAVFQAERSTSAAAGGAAGSKTSAENCSSTKIPAPPTSLSATRGSVNLTRRSKDAAPPKASAASSATRVTTRAAIVEQYALFMDFSKYLITVLLNALAICVDQRSPPALPLPRCGQSSKVTAVAPPPISSDSSPAGPLGGSAGSGSQRNSRSASSARVHGTSFHAIEYSSSGSARESCFSSLPGISPPNGRLSNKAPAGARASLMSPPLSRDAEPQERGSSDSLCEDFKVSPERLFLSALDYLDDACRTLAQVSDTGLGKLAKIPAAPLSKSKTFPFRSNSARRH